jgi:hypothetical protein
MEIKFDKSAKENADIKKQVSQFLNKANTLEKDFDMPVIIFQDGKSDSYYIKCAISTSVVSNLLDLEAKLEASQESFKANRELLLKHNTYLKMEQDAKNGREFNDIIVEYNLSYNSKKPLKVWGGQHRSRAIIESRSQANRFHGFKVFFGLNKKQRTEVALISNTNIAVSNDTFDRIQEETFYGDGLRKWCQTVGFFKKDEDFPSQRSKSETITVKLARSFIVNFYLGKEKGQTLTTSELDKNIFEPYITETGITLDPKYQDILEKKGNAIWKEKDLLDAGKNFYKLHVAQYKAVKENPKVPNRKAFRNKALIESVIASWSYVAGLLESNKTRSKRHYVVPKTSSKIPDPLNAGEMSHFHHDQDAPTYRGLGARSSLKDRQRMAQVFLAKTIDDNNILDKKLLNKAVSQVIAIQAFKKGYTS